MSYLNILVEREFGGMRLLFLYEQIDLRTLIRVTGPEYKHTHLICIEYII